MAKRMDGEYTSLVTELPDDEPEQIADDGSVVRQVGSLTEVELANDDSEDERSYEFEGHDENIAEQMDESQLTAIGQELREYLEIDLQGRSEWMRRMEDGMEIIGLKDIPEDRVAFSGAASVTHPAIIEAIVQFQARAMEEVMPPEGPVKASIVGKEDDALRASADRVQDYMNYQLMEEDDEYYWEVDNMLFYLPYAGSAFKKIAPDPVTGMTRSRFVTAQDFVVPTFATSLKTAPRYTHMYTMSKNTYRRAVKAGTFKDCEFEEVRAASSVQLSRQTLEDKADERTQHLHEDDTIYTFCEMHVEYEIPDVDEDDSGIVKPYVITFEYETGKVVAIRRLWSEGDEKFQKQVWFSHFKYLPGFGFYGFGLLHLIGGLGRAASGALRALLDSSTTSSLSGGFKSRDARVAGDLEFEAGVWKDVDMTSEELAKSFYSPEFKPPQPALFSTLEILLSGIQRFAGTTENVVGDASNTGPVGTTVALIEQGSKIFSGIHKRLHRAFRQEFKMIAKCNYLHMSDERYPYEVSGESREVLRTDFDPRVDIIPVSDPNIFSSVQRIALAQSVIELQKADPELYDLSARRRAHRNMLKALKVPEAEAYLPEKGDRRSDPVSENQAMMTGGGAKAFLEQDHDSHMAVHNIALQEILGTQDPEIINRIAPAIKAHMTEHFAMSHRLRAEQAMMGAVGIPLPPMSSDGEVEELPIEIENAIARAVAATMAPPQPPPGPEDEEGAADMKAKREADRKDMLAQRQADREDAQAMAKAKREGLVPDDESLDTGGALS